MCLHVDVLTYHVSAHIHMCVRHPTRVPSHMRVFSQWGNMKMRTGTNASSLCTHIRVSGNIHMLASNNKCARTHACLWANMKLRTCTHASLDTHTCLCTRANVSAHTCMCLHTYMCGCTPIICIHPCHKNRTCKGQRARAHLWAHTTMYIHMNMFRLTHTRPCTRNVFACGRANIPCVCTHIHEC